MMSTSQLDSESLGDRKRTVRSLHCGRDDINLVSSDASKRGIITPAVNQLRDPAVFEDGDDLYLLYAVAGEQGIAVAKLELENV